MSDIFSSRPVYSLLTPTLSMNVFIVCYNVLSQISIIHSIYMVNSLTADLCN